MNSADRYERLRAALVREEPLLASPHQWTELELQAQYALEGKLGGRRADEIAVPMLFIFLKT